MNQMCLRQSQRLSPVQPAWRFLFFLGASLISLQMVQGEYCPGYTSFSTRMHEPYSAGAHRLSFMRPEPECRTFNSSGVEAVILRMKEQIYDPDLFRLFENAFPNTLDTAIRWKGFAANSSEQEELCFVITGDINAMWLRDSASQIVPYKAVLHNKTDDIASIFRGVINLQARYLIASPYCNAFHPPPESEVSFEARRSGYSVTPPYDPDIVFTCNFELDDFAGFLQLSHDYYDKTGDIDFFGRFGWVEAAQSLMNASRQMQNPTYAEDGSWIPSPYAFQSLTTTAAGTLGNNGFNSPVNYTGLVRSPFRPSDDAAMFDFGIAANMMFARYLESTAIIMSKLPNAPVGLAQDMNDLAQEIKDGIENFGIVPSPTGERIYAYEVDGFGGRNLMDDANIPSLLSAPFLGYLNKTDEVYQATRDFVLSRRNPWYCEGPLIDGVGSPHIRPGATWPMSSIVQVLTSDNDDEIVAKIKQILRSTDGLGLIHESISTRFANIWTRSWFTWANGLFGHMVLDLAERKPEILKMSFQPGPE